MEQQKNINDIFNDNVNKSIKLIGLTEEELQSTEGKYITNLVKLIIHCSTVLDVLSQAKDQNGEYYISFHIGELVNDIINYFKMEYKKGNSHIIKSFVANTYHMWDTIKQKDDLYFYKNAKHIFNQVPVFILNKFLTFLNPESNCYAIIKEKGANKIIWDYVHVLIKLSIKFIHEQSIPYTVQKPKDDNTIIQLTGYLLLESQARTELINLIKIWEIKNKDTLKIISYKEFLEMQKKYTESKQLVKELKYIFPGYNKKLGD